eukprot:tig00001694_g9573.t1
MAAFAGISPAPVRAASRAASITHNCKHSAASQASSSAPVRIAVQRVRTIQDQGLRGGFLSGSRSFHVDPKLNASATTRRFAGQRTHVVAIASPPLKSQTKAPTDHTEFWRGRKVLFVSTPVGAFGSGMCGGVELTLYNIAKELIARGVDVEIVAAAGSELPGIESIVQIGGQPQVHAQALGYSEPISMPADPLLGRMWEYVLARQEEADLVVNFAFDWLPLYLSPFLRVPVCHLISMGSINEAMDLAVTRIADVAPWTLAFHTQAQAKTFPIKAGAMRTVGNGFDLSKYKFNAAGGDGPLVWVGRIAQEKGLEDAVEAAVKVGLPLEVFGAMQDQAYFDAILKQFPGAQVTYAGFLPTEELAERLGRGRGLLVTPKWEEAFGNVVVEALAAGCPAIAYRRGGPQEIVEDGVSGFLVPADDVDALAGAVARLGEIDRAACRARAEAEYSSRAMGDRMLAWFTDAALRGAQPAPSPASIAL